MSQHESPSPADVPAESARGWRVVWLLGAMAVVALAWVALAAVVGLRGSELVSGGVSAALIVAALWLVLRYAPR